MIMMAEFATDQCVMHTQDIIRNDVLCMYNTAIAAAAQCLTESFRMKTMDSIHIKNPNSTHNTVQVHVDKFRSLGNDL